MKVILERKGFRYLGLTECGEFHVFEDSHGDKILTPAAKFVRKDGSVWFCNEGRPIEGRRKPKSVSNTVVGV